MRDRWYADHRDPVNWGVLLALAERHGVGWIVQFVYWRSSARAPLHLDGEAHRVRRTERAAVGGHGWGT